VLAQYSLLEASPVPVRAIGWVQPEQTKAAVLAGGYVLSMRDRRLGELTIEGCRTCPATASTNGLSWTEGDVTYTLRTAADPDLLMPRVIPLSVARDQLTGNAWDAPVLYAWYLPAFVAFSVWGVWSTLFRRTRS
jgi:hypothetical protein